MTENKTKTTPCYPGLRPVADLHTHTIASDHAFSTVRELAEAAAEKKLLALAITDHGPALGDAPHIWHFECQNALPEYLYGVRLLKGAECNVVDFDGTLDLPDNIIKKLDWVIASMHTPCLKPKTTEDHTRAWLKIAENPHVTAIGHAGTPEFHFDHEAVISKCRETGTVFEINNHSFSVRKRSVSSCVHIAETCARYGVPIVLTSDAHWAGEVGSFDLALEMLAGISFPEDLIVNGKPESFRAYFSKRKNITI